MTQDPAAPEQRALDLHLAGRRQGVRGDRRQHGVLGRRHLRHHEPARAGVHHRRRPVRARRSTRASTSSTTPATASTIFNHDMVVKRINGVPDHARLLLGRGLHQARRLGPGATRRSSATPTSATQDPVMTTRARTRRGRCRRATAHQAEFSHDNRFVLAADEDFNTHRFLGKIDQGAAGAFSSPSPVARRRRTSTSARRSRRPAPIVGDTRFVGNGVRPRRTSRPPTADVKIAVVEPRGCDFQDKIENAEARATPA